MEFAGGGFGSGKINLGEIQVHQVSTFERVWSSNGGGEDKKGATFYRPINVPDGYFGLGYYAQSNADPLQGLVLVATENIAVSTQLIGPLPSTHQPPNPPMAKPSSYSLVWSSESWEEKQGGYGYFWLPDPPEGYRALGFVVTTTPEMPDVEMVRCVRWDLTDTCETDGLIWSTPDGSHSKFPFSSWSMRPKVRGVRAPGVYVGTYYCNNDLKPENILSVACLKNANFAGLAAMPNLNQVHEIMQDYGPTVFLHPHEEYFPSSVYWFFRNGALLYKKDSAMPPEPITIDGSNLPQGGSNDGEYWVDLPTDEGVAKMVRHGDLQGAEVYVHVKPMFGGTFTDVAIWVFYPFNGAGTLKAGVLNIPFRKIGEHVGDWEHFTLRISNFTAKLWRIYLSQHSSGQWVGASGLEYLEGSANKAVIYAAKSGHANFPRAGDFLEGNTKDGVGIRNDTSRSKYFLDTSSKYQIIAAEYLQVQEQPWLQYMREWGPKVVYDTRSELDRIVKFLPSKLRHSVEEFFRGLPREISGEEGPTGPKAKDNWYGDERD